MDLLSEMTTYVILVISGLLPIANPFSTAPVFLAMTFQGMYIKISIMCRTT